MADEVILVDGRDRDIGYEDKDACHRIPVKLHRAFSVFIMNKDGEMLIQKRAPAKKTWPGYWSNACCSHPRRGEELQEAVSRRLQQELGFTCSVEHVFTFRYRADFSKEFGESEIDHVFVGQYDGKVLPNNDEIEEWRFVSSIELSRDVRRNPYKYSPWFRKALPRVMEYITRQSHKGNSRDQHPSL